MMLEPVKRLSEELANALKSRNSWTASIAPFPNAMKVWYFLQNVCGLGAPNLYFAYMQQYDSCGQGQQTFVWQYALTNPLKSHG